MGRPVSRRADPVPVSRVGALPMHEGGWGPDHYQRWLARTLVEALVKAA